MSERFKFLNWLKPRRAKAPKSDFSEAFRARYESFQELLASNKELLKIITDLEEKLRGQQIFGMSYVRTQVARATFHTLRMIRSLNALSAQKYPHLFDAFERINARVKEEVLVRKETSQARLTLPYSSVTKEMVDTVGGKSANLGEVLNRAGLPVPEGFAITTAAYDLFLARNELVDEIQKRKMELDPKDPESFNLAGEDIQRLIITAPVPDELRDAILESYEQMIRRVPQEVSRGGRPRISMRSSAIGEDSDLSFAGQYLSLLNVPHDKIVHTYVFIIGSLFTPRAISYRLNMGIRDEDVAMSVACLRMVDSVASGIVYSRHPFNLLQDNVIITAVWGLGPYAVDGVITPDSYTVAKDSTFTILETKVSHKPVQLASDPDGGLIEIPVPEGQRDAPCLSSEQIRLLADYAARLEKHYGCPQDMEWALDRDGTILVLQTRPLRLESCGAEQEARTIPELSQYPLLVPDGAVASPGVGFGKAFLVRSEEDLVDFPDGAVLVAKHSSPKYVVVMNKASAIVTDSGSVTGHMASVAREFGIPAILDAKVATSSIPGGAEITVDGYSGRVYQGKVQELLSLQIPRESHMKGTPVYETLKRVSEWIVPLRLFDPKSPEFTPEHCKSIHDIMRFVHESSYTEMFRISDHVSETTGGAAKLEAPIPLDLYVIDLGGGLKESAAGRTRIKVNQVTSIPFCAVLKGMLHEDLRYHRPRPVHLSGFLSVMSEQMLTPAYSGAERFGDRSYAVISDKYLNFSSRVGYHYGVLDSYCGRTISNNYITFSFKGGAADDIRRSRRARAIAKILDALDFVVEVVADRVDARFQKHEAQIIEDRLDQIGRLLQFTRQMDMLMDSDMSVALMAEAFLQGDYQLEAGGRKESSR